MFDSLSWKIYLIFYIIISLLYLWYRFILLAYEEYRNKKIYTYNNNVSIIIPCFNEKPELLEQCIKSILQCKEINQIILIDDLSTNKETIKKEIELKDKYNITLLKNKYKKGKRGSQVTAFKYIINDIVVLTDSDTIFYKDTITELIKPYSDKSIGATTGFILPLNRNKNILTKLQYIQYWIGLNIGRKSISSFGVVTCCSGAVASYRKEILIKNKDEYLNQTFLNKECNNGDDRVLTRFALRNYKVAYCEKAIVETDVPETLFKYLKQQLRWKRGFIRESLLTLKENYKTNKILSFEVVMSLFIPLLSLAIRTFYIILCFISLPFAISFIISVILLSYIRNIFLIFFSKDKKVNYLLIPYTLMSEFILYWLYFIALFNLTNKEWGTR